MYINACGRRSLENSYKQSLKLETDTTDLLVKKDNDVVGHVPREISKVA